jgi:hypothetical protein
MLNLKADNYLFIVFEETRVKNLVQNYQKKFFLTFLIWEGGLSATCEVKILFVHPLENIFLIKNQN